MAWRESVAFGKIRAEKLTVKDLLLGGDPLNESEANSTAKAMVSGVTFTIGTEAADVINVALDLGTAQVSTVFAFLSDDADGIGIAAAAPSGGVAIGTDGKVIVARTAGLALDLQSADTGLLDLDITEAGAKSFYLVVVIGGAQFVSEAITFA